MNKKILILFLAAVTIVERTLLDLGPNVELVTTLLIASTFYLSSKQSHLLVGLTLVLTDFLIGNTNIFIFTWSGFLLPALLFSTHKFSQKGWGRVLVGTFAGIAANIFFFFWTNFGVWYLDSWGMYPDNTSGLIQSFIAGLPFLKYQLSSTLYFIPLVLILFEFMNNNLKFRSLSPLISFKLKKLNQKSQYASSQQ